MKGRKRFRRRLRARGSLVYATARASQRSSSRESRDVFYAKAQTIGYADAWSGRRKILKVFYCPPYERTPDGLWLPRGTQVVAGRPAG